MSALLIQSQPNRSTTRAIHGQAATIAGSADDLTLAEATDLLDWLEQRQMPTREVVVGPDCRVSVRWGQ